MRYNIMLLQLRERGQLGRRLYKHTTPAKPRGVQKVKASPSRRLQPAASTLASAISGFMSPCPQALLTPAPSQSALRNGKRARPRAPVKRISAINKITAAVPSPPAVVVRHFGAGADGRGHSTAAVAACDLFVKQQERCYAQARQKALDEQLRALSKAAGQQVSTCTEMQSLDASMAQADSDRCRRRLADLSTGRRLRLARQQDITQGSPRMMEHAAACKAVGNGRGLQECTSTMMKTWQGSSLECTGQFILPQGYFQ